MSTSENSRDSQLEALIRLIPPARALKDDLEKRLHLELYAGTGDFAIKNFEALRASVMRVTDDPYLSTLALEPPVPGGDKEKVSLAALAASQLVAYLLGQTGIAAAGLDLGGAGQGKKSNNISTGVHINLTFTENQGVTADTYARIAELASESMKLSGSQNEAES